MTAPLPGVMPPLEKPGTMPADFVPLDLARQLLRGAMTGTLGTIDRHAGFPMGTLVTVGLAMDGAPVLLLSKLASHTANLEADPRASLLIAQSGKGDPLAHPRLTVFGPLTRIADAAEAELARAFFLARHPKSKLYAGFADFGLFRMDIVAAHLNGGFARAADLKGDELLVDLTGAEDLTASAAGALEHMNADHRDSLQTLAAKAGSPGRGRWRMVGLDPEGFDLVEGEEVLRLTFPQRVTDGDGLRKALVAMVRSAA